MNQANQLTTGFVFISLVNAAFVASLVLLSLASCLVPDSSQATVPLRCQLIAFVQTNFLSVAASGGLILTVGFSAFMIARDLYST